MRHELVERLELAGFVAAEEDADELLAAAGGSAAVLEQLVARRLTGEPLAWIVGGTVFAGAWIVVQPGVYVPRWHTEALAWRAVARLPVAGVAVDVCTGSGAVACVLAHQRPQARVIATDIDAAAVACAVANGVEAVAGDLFAAVPAALAGVVDVVTAVAPYVPTTALPYLQRDTFSFEDQRSYHGGADGLDVVRRVAHGARAFLRVGGAVLLEIGGDEAEPTAALLAGLGYEAIDVFTDEEGDVRGIEATFGG